MVRTHQLTSEETVAIFTPSAARSLFRDLRKKRSLQRQFLSRLHDALTSPTPRAFVEKPFEGVENLMQFRAGATMRGYCVFADEPPGYNVFYLFFVTDHAYDRAPAVRYDADAGEVLDELRYLSSIEETEAYLADHDALDADAIETILDRI